MEKLSKDYHSGETPISNLRNALSPMYNLIAMLDHCKDDIVFSKNEKLNELIISSLELSLKQQSKIHDYLNDLNIYYDK